MAEEEQAESQTESVEAKAKLAGWVDQENYDGRGEFVDAETFLERTEEEVPLMRNRLRRQEEALQTSARQMAELQQTVQDFSGFQKRAEENAYKRAVVDLQQKQRAAVEEGDTASFDAAQKEIESLEAPQEPQSQRPQIDPAFTAWKAENSWYGDDMRRTLYADQMAEVVARKMGTANGSEFYEAVAAEVEKEFAEPVARRARTVERGGLKPRKASNGKAYSDLPPGAKEACDRYVGQKLMTRDEYVKEFWESEDE